MRVEVQNLSQWSKLDRRFFAFISKAVVTVPNDRPLAAARVDRDERDLVCRAFNDLREVDVDVVIYQRLKSKLPFRIGPETSGVSRLQSETPERHHRSRRLPARRLLVREQSHLRVERRILGHDNQVIDGIQSETDGVKRFVCGKAKWKMHLSRLK